MTRFLKQETLFVPKGNRLQQVGKSLIVGLSSRYILSLLEYRLNIFYEADFNFIFWDLYMLL